MKKKAGMKAQRISTNRQGNKSKAKVEEPAIDLTSEGWPFLRQKGIPAGMPSHVIYNFHRHSTKDQSSIVIQLDILV